MVSQIKNKLKEVSIASQEKNLKNPATVYNPRYHILKSTNVFHPSFVFNIF